jgi:glycosyltransferase involved in cell wall biosynthesis
VNLVLFSASFPYVQGGESNFLSVETQYLSGVFDHVFIIPETIKDSSPVDHVGLAVDTNYAQALASTDAVRLSQLAFSSPIIRRGLREPDFPRTSFTAWRRLIAFSGKAELTRRWTLDFLRRQNINPQDCLFYTYWFDHATTGVAFVREQFPELRLVTRAHGYDVYAEEYYDPPFFPCRQSTLPFVDRLFPDSRAGTDHLKNCHPEFSSRIEMSLLGVVDPGFLNPASTDDVFRIISCSMIRPEKRIGLIFEAVKYAAERRPHQRFEWTHIGNGSLRSEFQKRAAQEYPPNASAHFPGYSDHMALMRMYREQPLDLFMNLSETEGTPVSIMEAISCGIPILATAVGGNREIVSGRNGFLVEKDASADEISSVILEAVNAPREMVAKRTGSRQVWETHYNAHHNFSEFTETLKQIRLSR